jgi:hypothetical protein
VVAVVLVELMVVLVVVEMVQVEIMVVVQVKITHRLVQYASFGLV